MKIQEHRDEATFMATQMERHKDVSPYYDHESISLMALALEKGDEQLLKRTIERTPRMDGDEDIHGAMRYLGDAITRAIKASKNAG